MCATSTRWAARCGLGRALRPHRRAGLGRRRQLSLRGRGHVLQRLQGGGRHRPGRQLPCAAPGPCAPAQAGCVDHQHHGAAILRSDAPRRTPVPPRPASTSSRACWRSNGAGRACASIRSRPGRSRDTGGLSKLVSEAERSRIEGRIPLRRVGQLGDIAEMALFLGSTRASYITGALIPVDGGISLLGGRNYAGDPEPTRPTKA